MDGRLAFFNALARVLEQQTSGCNVESLDRDDSLLQLRVIHVGAHPREVLVNFAAEAAGFLHPKDPWHGVSGPFAYSADGSVVTRSRDGKQFAPEDLAKEILTYLRGEAA